MRRALADLVDVCAGMLLAGILAAAEPPPEPRRAQRDTDGALIWVDA